MHQILIRRVKFSNLLSYGNAQHEVRLDRDGITWIKGPNGAGKSTIIEALTFAFFGSAYRKTGGDKTLPLKHLYNTANSKQKLMVEVEFERIDSKNHDTYVITRYMSKAGVTSFKIKKNDEDELKGAGTTQKKIEEEYLGFNKNIFENVISLNTIQTKPIIEMSPNNKRKLLESILTLSIDKFKDLNAKALKEASTKFHSATSDVEKYGKDVDELTIIIEQMEQERADDITEMKNDLEGLQTELDSKLVEKEVISTDFNDAVERGKTVKNELLALGDVDAKLSLLEEVKVLIPQLHAEEKSLEVAESEFAPINDEYGRLKVKMEEYDISMIESKIDTLTLFISDHKLDLRDKTNTLNSTKSEQERITTKAKQVEAGVPCQTCGKPSTEEDVEKLKASYREEWKQLQVIVKKVEEDITKIESEIEEKTEELKSYQVMVDQYKEATDAWKDYFRTFQTAQLNVTTIKNNIKVKRDTISKSGCESVESAESSLRELDEIKLQAKNLGDQVNNIRNEATGLKASLTSITTVITDLTRRVTTLKTKIADKENNVSKDSLSATKDKLAHAKQDLQTAHNRVDKYSDQIAINKYIAGMYGDDGIKQIVLGIFMPNLNRAIAHNMKLFNLPYTVKFNDSMDLEFSSRFGLAEVYYGLSEGQKRKINFAIAISFRDFVSAIADFKINTLFLDEVLDISTDMEALSDMMMLIKDKVKEIGNIQLISHRGEHFQEHFDYCLEVSNDGRYSSINEVELVASKTNY